MRITDLFEMTAGCVAPVAMPLGGTRKRTKEAVNVNGLEPAKKVMSGNLKKKGPYANSLSEGKMKDLDYDMKNMKPAEFMKKYGKKREDMAKSLTPQKPGQPKPVSEAELSEQDLIVVPGLKRKSSELMSKDANELERMEMALSDLKQSVKSARSIHAILKSSNDEIEGWVQEKLAKAEDYLNTVREYLEGKVALEMRGGTIAGGVAFEGAKVDRMVKHIEKSEKKLGKSDKEAENIAWATANKRGMLDNKNKKKK